MELIPATKGRDYITTLARTRQSMIGRHEQMDKRKEAVHDLKGNLSPRFHQTLQCCVII